MSKKTPWPKYNKTLPEMFYGMTARYPDETVFRFKKDGVWREVTWRRWRSGCFPLRPDSWPRG